MILKGKILDSVKNIINITCVYKHILVLIDNKTCKLYKLVNNEYKLAKLPKFFEFIDVDSDVKIIYNSGGINIVDKNRCHDDCEKGCDDICIIPYPVGITGMRGPTGCRGGVEQLVLEETLDHED